MKRRRKRNLFGKRNHYRRPTARKLATGLENLERRALLTGLVGWEVMDRGPGIEKEDGAFEKMSQKRDQGPVEKQVRVNMKKLKLEKNFKHYVDILLRCSAAVFPVMIHLLYLHQVIKH